MTMTFGGQPCLDNVAEWRNVAKAKLPFIAGLDRANSYYCPLGAAHGRGWLLMLRENFNAIDVGSFGPPLKLIIRSSDTLGEDKEVVVPGLRVAKALTITPGAPGDPKAAMLIEIVDNRYMALNPYFAAPIYNRQYNVFAPNTGGKFYDYSRIAQSGGSYVDWSWSAMLADIWLDLVNALNQQAPPNNIANIDAQGKPINFQFVGVSAWKAFNLVLDRVSWSITPDLRLANPWTLVKRGGADPYNAAVFSANAGRLIYDAQPREIIKAKIPYAVRVLFNRVNEHYGSEMTVANSAAPGAPAHQWLARPAFFVEVVGNIPGSHLNSLHYLWDDLLAVTDFDGALFANSQAALVQRANDRANNYFNTLVNMTNMHQIYTGIVPFLPGPLVSGVCWRQDQQGGLVTEVIRHAVNHRVSEEGFEEYDCFGESSNLKPPDFNPTFPVYPQLLQLVEVKSNTPTGAYWPASVIYTDPTQPSYNSTQDCLLITP